MTTDAHFLVQQAKTKQELEDEVRFDTFIDKVSHSIAADGSHYTAVGHNKRVTPLKARNTIRRLRSLGFAVYFIIRKGSQFEAKYVTDVLITLP